MKQVNQGKREIRCECKTAGSGGGRGTLLPSLQNSVGVVLLYPRLWTTSGRRPQWETGWVGLQGQKRGTQLSRSGADGPREATVGLGRPCPLLQPFTRPCTGLGPHHFFLYSPLPQSSYLPTLPQPHSRRFATGRSLQCCPCRPQWGHAVCTPFPAVTHLGRGASVYGPRCLQMPLGSLHC